MSEYTRPATWDDLRRLAQYLEEAGVEYALVGGYALGAHGLSRFTEDVDLLVNPSEENSRRWIVARSRLPDNAVAELAPNPDVFAQDQRYAVRVNDEFTIDLLPAVGGKSWLELQPFVERIALNDGTLKVLSLEGLLLTKQGERPKDQADAALLRHAIQALRKSKL